MVSVNDVYQKVLVLANKEQRGYITPQEFNLLADHAQKEIFEQYFYDLNQSMRLPGNNAGHSDITTNLEEKISLFERYDRSVQVTGDFGDLKMSGVTDMYRLQMIRINYSGISGLQLAEEIQLNELNKYATSPLGVSSKKRPVYTRYSTSTGSLTIRVYPYPSSNSDSVYVSYIRKPSKPTWGYEMVSEKALYDSDNSNDFDLHDSEESELVYRILALAGLAIQKPELTQTAAALEGAKVQQEKQ